MFEDEYYDILGKARIGLGLGFHELSRLTGLDVACIQALESGMENPDPGRLAALASALELEPARVVDLAIRPTPPATLELPRLSFVVPAERPFDANSYVFSCPCTRSCAIVDPGVQAAKICRLVEENRLHPACILLTHGHGDHVSTLTEVSARLGVRGVSLEGERPLLSGSPVDFVKPGHVVFVGEIQVVMEAVPGHTPGGAAISAPTLNLAFSGDSLFARSVGRCAGPAAHYRTFLKRIRKTMLDLPDQTILCTGHGPTTQVKDELRLNPFFP